MLNYQRVIPSKMARPDSCCLLCHHEIPVPPIHRHCSWWNSSSNPMEKSHTCHTNPVKMTRPYPLVICYIAIENGTNRNSWFTELKNGVHSKLLVYQRVNGGFNGKHPRTKWVICPIRPCFFTKKKGGRSPSIFPWYKIPSNPHGKML